MRRESLQIAIALRIQPQGDGIKRAELLLESGELVVVIARGRQRVAPLQLFRGLLLGFSGRGELLTLGDIEAHGPAWRFVPPRLWSAWYVNELLIRLLPRQIPHEDLFTVYQQTLDALQVADLTPVAEEIALRRFELHLVDALGYGLALDGDAEQRPLQPQSWYDYRVGEGAWPLLDVPQGVALTGAHLQALAAGDLADLAARRAAKQLMRYVIDHLLNGQPLYTRQLRQQWQRPSAPPKSLPKSPP